MISWLRNEIRWWIIRRVLRPDEKVVLKPITSSGKSSAFRYYAWDPKGGVEMGFMPHVPPVESWGGTEGQTFRDVTGELEKFAKLLDEWANDNEKQASGTVGYATGLHASQMAFEQAHYAHMIRRILRGGTV